MRFPETVRLIVIYGMAATGTLTAAHELAATTGYRLFQHQPVEAARANPTRSN